VRIFYLLLAHLLALGFLQASGGGNGRVADSLSATNPPMNEPLSQSMLKASSKVIFQRVVQARLFHAGTWTLEGTSQTPVTVSRTLASLQPSFITGLLRLPDHGPLSNAETEAYATVRSAVLAANKSCRFDVLINAGAEHSGETFARRMKECSVLIHPDAWTFYVAPDTVSLAPEVLAEGIASAHEAGQMVGYDGPLSMIPKGVDYIVVRAWELKINRRQIDLLRAKQHVPLIVELPTTFGDKNPAEVISYVEEMDSSDRAALITQLAEDQSSWGYHLAYPVFYPLYPARHAFDTTKDNILLVSIRALLAKFN
jgi:hypothetical protein